MRKPALVLIGMPSCGKTTVGKALSALLHADFRDTDQMLEQICRMTPSTYIRLHGEEEFRLKETEIIRSLTGGLSSLTVIATGGGAPMRAENVALLRSKGVIFYLDTLLDNLTPTSDRPLSSDADALRRLWEIRTPVYRSCADFIVENNREAEETARDIREIYLTLQ